MLKWIASGCLVVLLVVCVVAYAGYSKMKAIAAAGPSVTVAIHAPPARVFASMSHTDSLSSWFAPGSQSFTTRHGPLGMGDSIFMVQGRGDTASRSAWVIDTVVPNQLIARRLVIIGRGGAVFTRRDSLAADGDSTLVTSTLTAYLADSLGAARSRASGATGGLIDMVSTMGTAGGRMQAETELKQLKRHIEGPPVSRP
jgi:uncharacterized protein YndB with AHSA1/START domain